MIQFWSLVLKTGLSALTVSLVFLTVGYAVVGWTNKVVGGHRLLAAGLSGLGVLLLSVSIVSAHRALGQLEAFVGITPAALSLLHPRIRSVMWADARWLRQRRWIWIILFVPVAAAAGLLHAGGGIHTDATGNHDSFFWITGADYLMKQGYLSISTPLNDPVFAEAPAFAGMYPPWGRMGTEGLIAFSAQLLGKPPLEIYLPVVLSLWPLWMGCVLGLAHSFSLLPTALHLRVVGCLLQPLFFFTAFNGNLPNLLGAILAGYLFSLFCPHALNRWSSPVNVQLWLVVVLTVHGMLVTYPEIVPILSISIVSLVAVTFCRLPPRSATIVSIFIGLSCAAGFLVNPLTTLRAYNGLKVSFGSVRADLGWVNLFDAISGWSYTPAYFTLSLETLAYLGPIVGATLTVAMIFSLGSTLWASPQRLYVLASLSGSGVLLVYTSFSEFTYGWQKAAQCAAIPISAFYPFAALLSLSVLSRQKERWKQMIVVYSLLPSIFAFWDLGREAVQNAHIKSITPLMSSFRNNNAFHGDARIFVHGTSFQYHFFHSMWAVYLFPHSGLYFDQCEPLDGGYLAKVVRRSDFSLTQPNVLHYVGREWADAFCTELPRVHQDSAFALLPAINRMEKMSGLSAQRSAGGRKGVPQAAAADWSFTFTPVMDGVLRFSIATARGGVGWRVWVDGFMSEKAVTTVPAALASRVAIPLVAGHAATVRVQSVGEKIPGLVSERPYPFLVEDWSFRSDLMELLHQ